MRAISNYLLQLLVQLFALNSAEYDFFFTRSSMNYYGLICQSILTKSLVQFEEPISYPPPAINSAQTVLLAWVIAISSNTLNERLGAICP